MNEKHFWKSTPQKIGTLWNLHKQFNGWTVKNDNENNTSSEVVYKKMNIEDVPFL